MDYGSMVGVELGSTYDFHLWSMDRVDFVSSL